MSIGETIPIQPPNELEQHELDATLLGSELDFSIFIITKNAIGRIPKCLSAIHRDSPDTLIIVIDGGSTDGTPDYAESAGCIVFREGGRRGQSRQTAIELGQIHNDDFIFFIDDDVIIPRGFFDRMFDWMYRLPENVGALTGTPSEVPLTEASRLMSIRMKLKPFVTLGKIDVLHTGACLIKTEAVKGIKTPSWIQIREDAYISDYIRSRGFQCWRVPVEFIHYVHGSWESMYSLNAAHNWFTRRWTVSFILKRIAYCLGSAFRMPTSKAFLWSLLEAIYTYRGIVQWRQYLGFD